MARLMLAGTPADVIYETVGIESLRLNPENPRIRFLLKYSGGKKDQKSLMELIKAQSAYDPLQKPSARRTVFMIPSSSATTVSS